MIDQEEKGMSYSAGFFILIGFTVAALIFASFLSIPIWEKMTGLPISKLKIGMTDPANSNAVKVIQSVNTIIGFLLPALIVASLLNRKPTKLLGFRGNISWKQVSLVFGIMVIALFVSASLSWLNEKIPISESWKTYFIGLEEEYKRILVAIMNLDSPGDFILALFIMAFVPAFCEEALFRGGLQNFMVRSTKRTWLSIITVSIIFSLAHQSYYGFLSRFFLGVTLGAIYQYTGRIWLSITGHFLNNAIALTFIYVSRLNGQTMSDAVDEKTSSYLFIVLLPLVFVLLSWLKNISNGKNDRNNSPVIPANGLNTTSNH
ncbi:MAG TPA: type II CAAX endopeptidase family protein [Chitinophagaceae bacterium]|nr:type II CAAX endopeptidase family protein [Chitinophagaceae bacterium]